MIQEVRRRDLLTGGAVLAGGAALPAVSGCSFFSTAPRSQQEKQVSERDRGAKESPMLAKLVTAGKLPALEDRLPAEPKAIRPFSEPGSYGGTLRTGKLDQNQNGIEDLGACGLVEWTKATPPEPVEAMARSYRVLDGGRTYEFVLRRGLKWSDGEPFTTGDLMFWYENILLNKELNPVFPTWLIYGDKPVTFVPVDATTIRFEFAAPNALFLRDLCHPAKAGRMWYPKHYLKQFHPDFVGAKKADSLARERKFESWADLFYDRDDQWRNPDRPVLGPWKISKPPGPDGHARADRNPYYWKVDPSGRQLPYIDHIDWVFLQQETFALRAAGGEIDLTEYEMSYQQAPLLLRNTEKHGFRVLRWKPDVVSTAVYTNQSHPDAVLRKLFNDIDFRAALSHAIDRDEMNHALLAGQGLVQHPCGMPGDPYFVPGMGQRFMSFDPGRSDKLLDGLGLTRRDSNGFRLRPDGEQLRLGALTFPVGLGLSTVDVLEFVKRYWAKVGIDLEIRNVSQARFYDEEAIGEYDLVCYPPACYLWDIDPSWFVPTNVSQSFFAPRYGLYYSSGGKEGVKPAGAFQELIDLYEKLKGTIEEKARIEVGRRILKLHDENVWIIGTLGTPFQPVVVNAELGNVREHATASWRTGYASATEPAELYFKTAG